MHASVLSGKHLHAFFNTKRHITSRERKGRMVFSDDPSMTRIVETDDKDEELTNKYMNNMTDSDASCSRQPSIRSAHNRAAEELDGHKSEANALEPGMYLVINKKAFKP